MRIIAGEFRGRSIKYPKNQQFRPTQDRVREAVFSILGDRVFGSKVIDLCCGTGGYGLEALSRGAAKVTLVDRDIQFAIENAHILDVDPMIIKSPLRRFLKSVSGEYDIIFLDPPYDVSDLYDAAFNAIKDKQLLSNHGCLIVEHRTSDALPDFPGQSKVYTYGSTAITVFTM